MRYTVCKLYLLFFLCWVFSPLSFAAEHEHPDPKDHPFNEQQPAASEGETLVLKTADGLNFDSYVAGPEDAKAGILLIHEWWGLNDHIRGQADRLAKQGYRALAIDLYGGEVTTDAKIAAELMQAVDQSVANGKLQAALDYLKAPERKIGTLGWCFGGGQSLQAALLDPDAVTAAVVYYGELVTDMEKLMPLKAHLLGIFAIEDAWITPEKVVEFTSLASTLGKNIEIRSFQADHAFANPSSPSYNGDIAQEAWQITQDFLDAHLKGMDTRGAEGTMTRVTPELESNDVAGSVTNTL